MAGPYMHSFISWTQSNDPSWAGRYVHAIVPVGGPWNGATNALTALVSSAMSAFDFAGDCPRCTPPQRTAPTQGDSKSMMSKLWVEVESEAVSQINGVLSG